MFYHLIGQRAYELLMGGINEPLRDYMYLKNEAPRRGLESTGIAKK